MLGWQKTVVELIEYVVDKGIPMEEMGIRSFRESIQQAHNTKASLIILHYACAKLTQKVSEIDWKSRSGAGSFLFQLRPGKDHPVFSFVYYISCLSYLDFGDQYLHYEDFCEACLNKSSFRDARLDGSIFRQAFLVEADLQQTVLFEANLVSAQLLRANLRKANLVDADLTRADLRGADLTGANLVGANLTRANLKYKQLITTESLYETTGIPEEILERIQETHPHLLEPPK